MLKRITSALVLAAAVIACEPGVEKAEPVVETVAFVNPASPRTFQKDGGTFTAEIASNCDWTLTASEAWVEVAKAAGKGNDNVVITIGTTTQGREADLVVECVNVKGRKDVIHIVQEGGKEIASVAATVAEGLVSTDGTTANFSSSFTAYGIKAEDTVTAGFTITSEGGEPIEVEGTIDAAASTFTGSATGLVAGTAYSVKAWARINSDEKVYGEPLAFQTEVEVVAQPVTVIADFSASIWSVLPTDIASPNTTEMEITDSDGYKWIVFGGAIVDNCLRLESTAKGTIDGYIILPKLEGKKVTSITVPNDGSGASGSAMVSIYVSTDGGTTFTSAGTDYYDKKPGTFEFSDQPEGAIYKIANTTASAGGRTKSTKITIIAE